VTRAVHRSAGRIYLQLWHVGRVGHCSLRADGSPPVGPSTIGLSTDRVPVLAGGPEPVLVPCHSPRALRTAEVREVVADFARAAANSLAAGFDGVEIHAANGYLFDQFRCPYLNDRHDEYGGTTSRRWRFLLETVAAVASVVGCERVGVRISPLGFAHEMQPDPAPLFSYGQLASQLDRMRIGYLHVYDQSGSWIHDRDNELLQHLRGCYGGSIILCGGFDRQRAEAALRSDNADLIAFGKHFIANPDLVERLRIGAPLAAFDSRTVYKGGERGYIDYPSPHGRLAARFRYRQGRFGPRRGAASSMTAIPSPPAASSASVLPRTLPWPSSSAFSRRPSKRRFRGLGSPRDLTLLYAPGRATARSVVSITSATMAC
jgi:N-ethylmaleimide reductase